MGFGRGDDGETDLLGNVRLLKSHPRIECIGEIDELSSIIGYCISLLKSRYSEIAEILMNIQHDLFKIGTELATINEKHLPISPIEDIDVLKLEKLVMDFQSELPELRHFIYPGGSIFGASLHFARAIARRAERRVVNLSTIEHINPAIIKYLNRLSTLLFVIARFINKMENCKESEWTGRR